MGLFLVEIMFLFISLTPKAITLSASFLGIFFLETILLGFTSQRQIEGEKVRLSYANLPDEETCIIKSMFY